MQTLSLYKLTNLTESHEGQEAEGDGDVPPRPEDAGTTFYNSDHFAKNETRAKLFLQPHHFFSLAQNKIYFKRCWRPFVDIEAPIWVVVDVDSTFTIKILGAKF